MFWKNTVATAIIRAYEHDLDTGVSLSAVSAHAEKVIHHFRLGNKKANKIADEIETWINKQNNP